MRRLFFLARLRVLPQEDTCPFRLAMLLISGPHAKPSCPIDRRSVCSCDCQPSPPRRPQPRMLIFGPFCLFPIQALPRCSQWQSDIGCENEPCVRAGGTLTSMRFSFAQSASEMRLWGGGGGCARRGGSSAGSNTSRNTRTQTAAAVRIQRPGVACAGKNG